MVSGSKCESIRATQINTSLRCKQHINTEIYIYAVVTCKQYQLGSVIEQCILQRKIISSIFEQNTNTAGKNTKYNNNNLKQTIVFGIENTVLLWNFDVLLT